MSEESLLHDFKDDFALFIEAGFIAVNSMKLLLEDFSKRQNFLIRIT